MVLDAFGLQVWSRGEIEAHVAAGGLLLDVREPDEFASGHVTGATLMPMKTVEVEQVRQLAAGQPVVVMCKSGGRSGKVGVMLQQAGIEVRQGLGVEQWLAQGGALV
ncbi:MAG: rhodanese-like domain-containing protein [Proteobacteria bacterium]|nr:rhodanese-like domain-containing protein [Pseudomonadota bacterium]NBX86060.1 rhodanese-like domain-containing protein [Pseudomonadota bacterium]